MNDHAAILRSGRRLLALLTALVLVFSLFCCGAACADGAEGPTLAGAYEYRLDSGRLKYWLDLRGDALKLHCFFRSGEPQDYEVVYTLDLDTAEASDGVLSVREIRDENGRDLSAWFRSLELSLEGETLVMKVERDEKTLAGGADDNLLTGRYEMRPMRVEGASPAGAYESYAFYEGFGCYNGEGALKYYVEFSEEFRLHCFFRSGDPQWYERVYTLYPDWEAPSAQELTLRAVKDEGGNDLSDSFKRLHVLFGEDTLILEVERDESRLAGGGDDNLLSGTYELSRRVSARDRLAAALCPGVGPLTLCAQAQRYYEAGHGFYPPEAAYAENEDGTWTIHLYEIVDDGGGMLHTATSAWYTVDAQGVGSDDIFGEPVRLFGW